MLESEHLPRPAERGLDLVEDQERAVVVTPLTEPARVLRREHLGVAALIGFRHDAADRVGRHPELGEAPLEQVE